MAVRRTKVAFLWMSEARPVETRASKAGRDVKVSSRPAARKMFTEQILARTASARALLLGEASLESSDGAPDLVGAYCYFHQEIYGIEPSELYTEWPAAVGAAKRALVNQFDGIVEEALDYLRWFASRAITEKKERRRPSLRWRIVFSGSAIADWRVANSRTP